MGAVAYFLKKSTNKKGIYLQIYESFYDPAKKQTAHRSVRAIGYVCDLKEQGIKDPIAHFQTVVDDMNALRRVKRTEEKTRQIAKVTPQQRLGYFPFKALDTKLGVSRELMHLQEAGNFCFSIPDLLSSLVYARLCQPSSTSVTFHNILPTMFQIKAFSNDQIYTGLEFLGSNYSKVIEIYNNAVQRIWGHNLSPTYVGCTNFYFELNEEDPIRRKGFLKKRRSEPIVGIDLLLDADCIPLNMQICSGKKSEKPLSKEAIDTTEIHKNVQSAHATQGKVVYVADKRLCSADNITRAALSNDSYLFSKSVNQLQKAELSWALSEEGWTDVLDCAGNVCYRYKELSGDFEYTLTDKNGEKKTVYLPEKRVVTYNQKIARRQRIEIDRQVEKAWELRLSGAKRTEFGDSAKYVTFTTTNRNADSTKGTKAVCALNYKAIAHAHLLAGYSMLITSELFVPTTDICRVYYNLRNTEKFFRVMKSQLDALPLLLQKPDSIKGHLLVCYIAVLLFGLLRTKVLKSRFSTEEIIEFAREFKVVEVSPRSYINISRFSKLTDELAKISGQPLTNYYLKKSDIDSILKAKLDLAETPT